MCVWTFSPLLEMNIALLCECWHLEQNLHCFDWAFSRFLIKTAYVLTYAYHPFRVLAVDKGPPEFSVTLASVTCALTISVFVFVRRGLLLMLLPCLCAYIGAEDAYFCPLPIKLLTNLKMSIHINVTLARLESKKMLLMLSSCTSLYIQSLAVAKWNGPMILYHHSLDQTGKEPLKMKRYKRVSGDHYEMILWHLKWHA